MMKIKFAQREGNSFHKNVNLLISSCMDFMDLFEFKEVA